MHVRIDLTDFYDFDYDFFGNIAISDPKLRTFLTIFLSREQKIGSKVVNDQFQIQFWFSQKDLSVFSQTLPLNLDHGS